MKSKEYIFLFDLDSTLTKVEILPEISKQINIYDEMVKLTEQSMLGKFTFEESFSKRVDMLKSVPLHIIQDIILNIDLNEELIKFIKENRDRCFIVTGNLDIWIIKLMKSIGMEDRFFSSTALEKNGYTSKIVNIIKKEDIAIKLNSQTVAIGDGSNDIEMIRVSDIGIAFGGVRNVAPKLLDVCDYAFFEEGTLCQFLKRLL